jgi:hypothetical protein
MKINERIMQAVIMRWALFEKNHIYALPGSTMFFAWESDVITITKFNYAHEFEIKISKADYKHDFKKTHKHQVLQQAILQHRPVPAYFWYATSGFDIDPPEYAGWLTVAYNEKQFRYEISIRKDAPRLHDYKITKESVETIAHLLSFRVATEYTNSIYRQEPMVDVV